MKVFEGIDGGTITLIVIICIAVIGALFVAGFLFYKFYLQRKRCHKMLIEIQDKYEYSHSLLTGQNKTYIDRLEIISRTNLLYADVHSTYLKRAKEIKDIRDYQVNSAIVELTSYYEDNKIKEFKEKYKETYNLVLVFEEEVDNLNKDLVEVIRPEEEARQKALLIKEKLRRLKSEYVQNEANLAYIATSIDDVFTKIDEKFKEFDEDIENAHYDEANEILPGVEQVVDTLLGLIEIIPGLVTKVTEEIPNSVAAIMKRYRELLTEGKPLSHLKVEKKIADINESLENSKVDLKKFKIKDIQERNEIIEKTLSELNDEFDREIKAAEEFSNDDQRIINDFKIYEEKYVSINNNVEKFRKYYVIDEEHVELDYKIKKLLDEVAKDKRVLDNMTHGLNRYPYSQLLEQLRLVEKNTLELKEKIEQFSEYLTNLKNDCEAAYKNIEGKYFLFKRYEAIIRDIKISQTTLDYAPKFDECFDLIDSIYNILMQKPINVNLVNEKIKVLNDKSNSLINSIQEKINYKESAASNIMVANRERWKFGDVNNLVSQAETFYLSGEFENAEKMSASALENLANKDQN